MKTRFLVTVLLILFFVQDAFAIPPLDSQRIYDFSDVIAVGQIMQVDSAFSPTHNLYHIKVEKFLKNPQESDLILAAGQNTAHPRLGNQVFALHERVLFFFANNTIGYDQYSGVLTIRPESTPVIADWDLCNIFENDIPREHWFLGGIGPLPKISQAKNTNVDNFTAGKEIVIAYDMLNPSPKEKNVGVGMLIKNLDDPASLYVYTETSSHLLEPCTPYKTLTWSFTLSAPGHYSVEFYDLVGSKMEFGFVVVGNNASGKNNTASSTDYVSNNQIIDFQAFQASEAKCVILGISGKEACSLQAFLTLGMFTSAIIGSVIAISMITLRRTIQNNL